MRLAIIRAGEPVELAPGAPVTFSAEVEVPPTREGGQPTTEVQDFAASWDTVVAWSEDERNARGIWTIVEPEVPEGQIIASSHLEGLGPIERVATFEAEPPPPVPAELTNFRGRAILEIDGLTAAVEAGIAAIADAGQRALATMAFERGNFPRSSPLLNSVLKSQAVGMSDEDIDDMFRRGQALEL